MDDSAKWGIMTAVASVVLVVILATQSNIFGDEELGDSNQNTIPSSTDNPDPLAFECLDHNGLARHDHATLRIFVDGEERSIPDTIGINTDACHHQGENMHIVHIHQGNPNYLHIESAEPIDIPLGVFFDIWDVHFDDSGIFDLRVNDTHQMRMTVDGVESNEFDDLLLLDGQTIAIYYEQI